MKLLADKVLVESKFCNFATMSAIVKEGVLFKSKTSVSTVKIAVMTRTVNNDSLLNYKIITFRNIKKLRQGMALNNCSRGIIFTSDKNVSMEIYEEASLNYIEIVNYEDLLRLAHQIENLNLNK